MKGNIYETEKKERHKKFRSAGLKALSRRVAIACTLSTIVWGIAYFYDILQSQCQFESFQTQMNQWWGTCIAIGLPLAASYFGAIHIYLLNIQGKIINKEEKTKYDENRFYFNDYIIYTSAFILKTLFILLVLYLITSFLHSFKTLDLTMFYIFFSIQTAILILYGILVWQMLDIIPKVLNPDTYQK